MAVVFDAKVLVALFDPVDRIDPLLRRRVEHLVQRIAHAKDRIIIPTPAMAEVLVGATNVTAYVAALTQSKHFSIEAFDQRAAIEIAAAHREAILAGDKKEGLEHWQKLKYDRQIVAIARVHNASVVYTGDADVVACCRRDGVPVVHLDDLPEPPEDGQGALPL